MIATGSRESVIQNLEDAGCETEMIQDFMEIGRASCRDRVCQYV